MECIVPNQKALDAARGHVEPGDGVGAPLIHVYFTEVQKRSIGRANVERALDALKAFGEWDKLRLAERERVKQSTGGGWSRSRSDHLPQRLTEQGLGGSHTGLKIVQDQLYSTMAPSGGGFGEPVANAGTLVVSTRAVKLTTNRR